MKQCLFRLTLQTDKIVLITSIRIFLSICINASPAKLVSLIRAAP